MSKVQFSFQSASGAKAQKRAENTFENARQIPGTSFQEALDKVGLGFGDVGVEGLVSVGVGDVVALPFVGLNRIKHDPLRNSNMRHRYVGCNTNANLNKHQELKWNTPRPETARD